MVTRTGYAGVVESSQPGADEVTLSPDGTPAAAAELSAGTAVGRYVIVARVGSGGMGVVYLAHDPELGRRIALKVLTRAGETSLREAQALARLSHPNVVTVHDVGTHGDRVWLAMEFVEGTTLGPWLRERERSWHEILDVLLDAGEGIVAAHSAGLIHRDVKPDNVMVAKNHDGSMRVLVTDFGLARELTASPMVTPVRGTPAYMGPERHRPGAVDGRFDQFGFCVTAWEALFGERPFAGPNVGALLVAVNRGATRPSKAARYVPGWLRRVLERGLDPDVERRWPDMTALLRQLRRGRARVRRRLIAMVAACVLAPIAVYAIAKRVDSARREAACEENADAIAQQWPGDGGASRETLRAALLASGVDGADATFDRVAERLDAWTERWRGAARAECVAGLAGRDPALHLAAMSCLQERRDALGTLVDTLGTADPMLVRRAVHATTALGGAESCADDADLLRRPAPPSDGAERIAELRRELERGRSQRHAGRLDAARTTNAAVVDAARELGWAPLLCTALVEGGRTADVAGDAGTAAKLLEEAFFMAVAADDPADAAEAATHLVKVVGIDEGKGDEALQWAAHAGALLERLGEDQGLRGAALAFNRGWLHRVRGDIELAIADGERALAIRRELLGEEHPDVAMSLNSLANAVFLGGDLDAAEQSFAAAASLYERTLGPDHPDTATAILNLGNVAFQRGELDQAATHYRRALEIDRAALGDEHPDVALALTNLGAVEMAAGRHDEAAKVLGQAVATSRAARGARHRNTLMAVMNLGTTLGYVGEREKAAALLDEAVDGYATTSGEDSYDHALALLQRGRMLVFESEPRAIDDLERSTAVFAKLAGVDGSATIESTILLGRALVLRDPKRGETLCRSVVEADERSGAVAQGRADAWTCLAIVLLAQRRDAEAAAAAELALENLAKDAPYLAAEARLVLARALWSDDAQRVRARQQAQQALDEARLASLRVDARAWLDAHPL
jgi:tetratricopeptide (TPR) repeat protein